MALALGRFENEDRIIEQLQELTWRGRRAPCTTADFRFSHDQARRKYPYVNGVGHDWTGLNEIPITAELYFVNTIEPRSFPDEWNFWLENLLDGSPGKLVHPVLGEMDAVVIEGSVKVTAQNKAGVIVSVTWEKTRLDLEQDDQFRRLEVNIAAVAAQCDADLATLGIPIPEHVPTVPSLLEAFNGIKGALFSAQLTVEGAINQIQGVVSDLIETVDNLNDARTWAAQTNLVTFWDSLRQMAENAARSAARPVASLQTSHETTLEAIAASVSNTLDDVIALNLSLLISPIVPKDTVVRFYR